MIVELKKVKITKSIFNQLTSPPASAFNSPTTEVLGWCFDKIKYTLLYDQDKYCLYRLPTIYDMKLNDRYPNTVFFTEKGRASVIKLSGISEANQWIARINEIQLTARTKGQIFI